VAGGGVYYSGAESALRNFAERSGIPVATTQAGKGVLPESHPLALGAIGVTGSSAANEIAESADLVIACGTRLSDFTTASKSQFQDENVRFLGINLNSFDARKHGAFPLISDARAALEALASGLGDRNPQVRTEIVRARESWLSERREILRVPASGGALTQPGVIAILNEFVDARSTIVHAAGGLPGDLHKLWMSRESGDYHSEYGYSCMGYEIAGALGVKLADPSREVYAFLGDGSYLMMNHEIVTSVQEGLKITVLMIENGGYQCIHGLQKSCGSSSFGNEFRKRDESRRIQGESVEVDYLANARSLGARVFDAPDEEGLRAALQAARRETSTCFIRVKTAPGKAVPGYSWWDVPVAEASGQPAVTEARKRYEEALRKTKFYY
jgi:3D-(3,5/4)-trihydroxycyclohexane-1,2-dione acylhydrolase (decyclizing)